MSAPTEPRSFADLAQAVLAAAERDLEELFGPRAGWPEAVQREYRIDQLHARQRATNWEEAA